MSSNGFASRAQSAGDKLLNAARNAKAASASTPAAQAPKNAGKK